MKKYIALTLALLMSLSLMACGSKTDNGSTDADGSGDQELSLIHISEPTRPY